MKRIPIKAEIMEAELWVKDDEHTVQPEPQWKEIYIVSLMVDGRQAFLKLPKKSWKQHREEEG